MKKCNTFTTEMFSRLKQLGPGILVAAAFIGPGTVTTATLAGSSYGYTLLWAIVFSIIATVVLQEMTVRLGVVGQLGLGEAVRKKTKSTPWFIPSLILICLAIVVGNAAYEAGNLTGAVFGFADNKAIFLPMLFGIGAIAFGLLWTGNYAVIEKFIIALVCTMGVVFLIAALILRPNFAQILSSLFVPTLPHDGLLLAIGLIGTTVVPYNLFLHAATSKKKFTSQSDIKIARLDTILSIILGGIITMSILVTSAVAFEGNYHGVKNFTDLSAQLEPLLGSWSKPFMAFGFLAAGLSSAITAPLAAGYAISELLNWKRDLKSRNIRIVWISILLLGLIFSSLGIKPTQLILIAQVANGILLPVISIFLLWVMNDKNLLGKHKNSILANIFAILIIAVTIGLGAKSLLSALNFI